MRYKILILAILSLVVIAIVFVMRRHDPFDQSVNTILRAHYTEYKDKEYFSGIALSIYTPKKDIKNYYIGQVSHDAASSKIDDKTLFEIGSITKSFTAAIMLQLVKEGKLRLTDTLQQWLPEYSKWADVKLEAMLNMTSGLPNYTDAPLMNVAQFQHPEKVWTDKELIQYVYPAGKLTPPLKDGYAYTNTGYILAAMVIERITKESFQTEIESRLIKPLGLSNTLYPLPSADKQISPRLASGYGFNPYTNPELVGKDMRSSSLSWAGAAGAVISNTSDVIKWVKALFMDNKILDQQQKKQLTQLVSTTTGKPTVQSTGQDPRAFGLGVIEGFDKEMGRYWFYEGETEGYRALYMYVPSKKIIIAAIFNSAVNSENDHAGELMKKIYQLTKAQI